MSEPLRFLTAFTQALSTFALYGPDHPATSRSTEAAYRRLADLQSVTATFDITFLSGEVLMGHDLVTNLDGWEWSRRFSAAGIERLEVTGEVAEDHFARFMVQVAAALGLREDAPADLWQAGPATIRFGRVKVDGLDQETRSAPRPVVTLDYSLQEERQTVEWLHQEAGAGGKLPMLEAYGVVQSLSLAIHGGQAMVLPLLQLKEFDQYTTTHALNVAVLAMGLAEYLGMGSAKVRALGMAGLLHDLGKVRIPHEILTKPGKLTPEERRVVEAHPADGARLILSNQDPLDLAATVAYEHHLHADGGGYPHLHYDRDPHQASRLVHVCDVYDALRTRRPYRDAWTSAAALAYIFDRSGTEFDPGAVDAFLDMMQSWDQRILLQSA